MGTSTAPWRLLWLALTLSACGAEESVTTFICTQTNRAWWPATSSVGTSPKT